MSTYFETFVRAIEKCPDTRGVMGDEAIFPPRYDFGYDCTPRNAVVFGTNGVDGVHYAVLALDGAVTDESPVIQIRPMDFSDPYAVLGASFLSFLADACDVSTPKMEAVFAAERDGEDALLPFLRDHFQMSRLWNDERYHTLERYLELVEPKYRNEEAD